MTKDPAFLFYPADASNDTQFMNRLERGAYFDLVKGQRLYGGYTVVQLRKILGTDFETVWPALELVLEFDGEKYFVGWLKTSISKREDYSKKQSERVKKRWDNNGNTAVLPKKENENGIENEDENIEGVEGQNPKREPKKFIPPTEKEWAEFFIEKGLNDKTVMRNAYDHYALAGWKDSHGKPVVNWKQKVLTNWINKELEKRKNKSAPGLQLSGGRYPLDPNLAKKFQNNQ